MWAIGAHIASGLEFMHTYNHVHRELKPGNSTLFQVMKLLIYSVLYSRRENLWKLTDFGLTADAATTNTSRTTLYARGTSKYRAPELLKEEAKYNKKVDIWALGCILYELATWRPAFSQDWATREYFVSTSDLPIDISSLPPLLQHHVSGSIHDLLARNPTQRPSASTVRSSFQSYCQFFDISMA
jgi:serine/threonine protein kinase